MSTIRTGRREAFTLEDVAQMTTTGSASDLDALHAPGVVGVAAHSAGDGWCTRH